MEDFFDFSESPNNIPVCNSDTVQLRSDVVQVIFLVQRQHF